MTQKNVRRDWETFESAKKAINADDYEAYERIKKKVPSRMNPAANSVLYLCSHVVPLLPLHLDCLAFVHLPTGISLNHVISL